MRRLSALFLLVLLNACASSPPNRQSDAAPQAAQALQNVIRWSTASEVDNFGYDVFRGPTEEGPFERVNDTPIAGHGTTDVPQNYEFRDTSIAPLTAYFYYVESISLQGDRERFTPVFQSRPKGGN
jgi:hypothetical protein